MAMVPGKRVIFKVLGGAWKGRGTIAAAVPASQSVTAILKMVQRTHTQTYTKRSISGSRPGLSYLVLLDNKQGGAQEIQWISDFSLRAE